MKPASDGKPRVGSAFALLGARVPKDIAVDSDGFVEPRTGGMSTYEHPDYMRPEMRPPEFGGIGQIPLYLFEGALSLQLSVRENPPHHFLVEPAERCQLRTYQDALAATRDSWRRLP